MHLTNPSVGDVVGDGCHAYNTYNPPVQRFLMERLDRRTPRRMVGLMSTMSKGAKAA